MTSMMVPGSAEPEEQQQEPVMPAPAAQQQPEAQDPPALDLLEEGSRRTRERFELENREFLSRSLNAAVKTDPDLAAETDRLGIDVGLDPEVVGRNIDKVRQLHATRMAERTLSRAFSPLRDQMMDYGFAKVAHDDVSALAAVERTILGWEAGQLTVELGELGERYRRGLASAPELERLAVVEERLKVLPRDGVLAGTAQYLGQMSKTMPRAINSGLAVGGAFATGVAIAGQLGPQVALPEEIATVPAAAITGFSVGFLAEVGRQSYGTESGNAYVSMRRQGYDHAASSSAAMAHGLVAAGLEMVPASVLGKPFKDLAMRSVRQKVAQSLLRPTLSQAAKKFALQYAAGVGSEVVTEVLQEVSQIVAEESARRGSDRTDLESTWSRGEVVERLADVATQTALGMMLLGGFGPGLNLHHNIRQANAAERSQAFFAELSKHAEASKLRARAPGQYEQFLAATVEGSSSETIYVDAQQFAETLKQSGIEREQLAEQLPEVALQLDSALATGGDVTMPTAAYAARLAGTDLGKALLPHLRTDPEGITPFQAEEIRTQQQQMVADVGKLLDEREASDRDFFESAERVEESMRQQLAATQKMADRDARWAAKFYQAFVVTQAAKAGMLPEAFDRKFMLRVVSAEQDPATVRQDPTRQAVMPATDATVPVAPQAAPIAAPLLPEAGPGTDGAQQLGAAATPETLRQDGDGGTRGEFDPKAFLATLHEKADASTFLHEASHYFLQVYVDMASASEATPAMRADLQVLLDWFGVKDLEAWNALSLQQQRKHHEAWASAFETYLFEAKAPSLELQGMFDKFAAWLRRVYRVIREINLTYRRENGTDLPILTGEVRGVMDRMLASEQSIEQAETVRGMVSGFQERQSMSAEEAAAHQQLEEESQAAAVSELTKAHLQQMRLLAGARGRILKARQGESKALRAKVQQEVDDQVRRSPVERARRWLKKGEFLDEDGKAQPGEREQNHKLATDAVEAMLAGSAKTLHGMVRKDGMAPDTIAQLFGFPSGRDLVFALAETASAADQVSLLTDRRMLEEHAEFVPGTPEHTAAVDLALHNEARKRLLAASMRHLGKGKRPVQQMLRAAKEAAKQFLLDKPLGQIHPSIFAAAAKRAGMQVEEALRKGDEALAVEWLGRQLLQTEMVGQAAAVREEVAEASDRIALFARPDDKLAKNRNIDFIRAGRALAAAYALGPAIRPGQEGFVRAALEAIKEEAVVVHGRLSTLLAMPRHHRHVRLRDFREVVEVADSLWEAARESQLLDAEGRRTELRAAVEELTRQVESLPARTAPGAMAAAGRTPSGMERLVLKGWQVAASLKRVDHWVKFMDGGPSGPFRQYLLDPLQRQISAYHGAKKDLIGQIHPRFMEVFERAGPMWDARIVAPELGGFVFRGKKELLGALLHTGTQSNFEKLLGDKRRQWGDVVDVDGERVVDSSRFDRFLARMFDEGVITQQDVAFVTFLWGVYKQLLPKAQEAHRKVYFYEFEAIETRQVATPWGMIEGGYAPARADGDEMQSPRLASVEATMEGLEQRFQFSVGAPRGFTLQRNPYFREPLSLDLGKQLQHFDEELRFIYLHPVTKDTLRITRHRDFSAALGAYDREAITGILQPMVENAVRQSTTRPGESRLIDAVASTLQRAASLAALGFNVMNSVVQLTGLANARAEVKPVYHRAALAMWARSPRQTVQAAVQRSELFARRQDVIVRRQVEDIKRLAESSPMARNLVLAQQTMGRAAFFLQRMFQGVSDTVTWHGAYAQAIAEAEEGLTALEAEEAAVHHADGVLKRTQGSNNPEDAAAYEVGTPTKRLMVQFTPYSNVVLNTILSAKPGSPKLAALGWALVSPALIEATIKMFLVGTPDEDDDGKLDDIATAYFRSLARNAAGLVPVLGPSMLAAAEGDSGRVMTSPAATIIRDAVRGVSALSDVAIGEDVSGPEARALGALLTLLTGLPFAPVGRAVGYDEDVEAGKREPTGPVDYARGLVIGR